MGFPILLRWPLYITSMSSIWVSVHQAAPMLHVSSWILASVMSNWLENIIGLIYCPETGLGTTVWGPFNSSITGKCEDRFEMHIKSKIWEFPIENTLQICIYIANACFIRLVTSQCPNQWCTRPWMCCLFSWSWPYVENCQHIEAEKKWLPFYRQDVQIHFFVHGNCHILM